MTGNNRFDVLIMGAGQAGIPLALDLAKGGKRVALVEEQRLGLNRNIAAVRRMKSLSGKSYSSRASRS